MYLKTYANMYSNTGIKWHKEHKKDLDQDVNPDFSLELIVYLYMYLCIYSISVMHFILFSAYISIYMTCVELILKCNRVE